MATSDEMDPSLLSTRPHGWKEVNVTEIQELPPPGFVQPIRELPKTAQGPFNIVLMVTYVGGDTDDFEIRRSGGGWGWRYAKNPARLVIRTECKGTPRVEIPLARIRRIDVGRRYLTPDEG